MATPYAGSRAPLLFALCLPLAVLLGYMLAYSTLDRSSMLFVVLVIGILSIPVLMSWYHPVLLITWNAAITPFFLPGQPFVWMLVAFIGIGFAVLSRFTNPDARFVQVPSVNRALLLLLAVTLLTAYLRGGVGLRVLGSTQYGGKGYFYIAGAVAGYFALISKRVRKEQAGLLVGIFFLSALTALVPNLAYLGGPNMNFLFYLFPPVYAYEQALGDYSLDRDFSRIYGLTFASNGLYCFLLARYGLRGVLDIKKPLRLTLFILASLGTLFCGFRSFMLLFVLTVIAQFFAEKLYRPRILLAAGFCSIMLCAVTLPFLDQMPAVVQRSISFIPDRLLPVPITPVIRHSAQATSEWRLDMWQDVLPEVPKYLLFGKGYSLDPAELALAMEADKRGWSTYAWALVTGSYHNGVLTLLVPFGIWGGLAFALFVTVSIRYLHRQFRYGDPSLKTANTFLLAYFVARLVYYLGVFGNFYSDFFVFAGIIGLSVSLNGEEVTEPQPVPAELPLEELAPVQSR